MALEQLVNGMTGQQLANTIKNNFDKVLDVESAENKAENAGKALKTDYDATRYVGMELADGTPIRMRWDVFCQAIASVVAEQIGVKGHDKLNGTSYINNANERTVLSVFRGNNDNVNTPEKYGLMVVYSALGYVNQTFYSSIYKGRIYQRFYGDSSWSSWQRIDCIQ